MNKIVFGLAPSAVNDVDVFMIFSALIRARSACEARILDENGRICFEECRRPILADGAVSKVVL